MNASTLSRRFTLFFAALSLTPLLASAAPMPIDFKVLIDTDNSEATGCTVVTTAGLVKGVDQILTTSVTYDGVAATASVTGVTRQTCTSSTLNTFSSSLPVDTTGWPVGVGSGGQLTVETHIPTTALGGFTHMHLAFTAVSGSLVDGVAVEDDGSSKIIWPPLPEGRRHVAGLASTRVITLDGADGDWFGVEPMPLGFPNSSSPSLRFVGVRTYMTLNDVFFVINAQANANAPTANDDTYSVERGGTLGIGIPGVLANDTDPNHKPLTAILISGSGTHHGSLVLNPDGSFSYVNDGSPAPSDSFEYKANNGSADSNTAHVEITITEPNAGPPPVAPQFTSANHATFTVGSFGSFTITTTPVNPASTITKTGALPAGVNFTAVPSSTTAKISGTPAPGSAGVYTLHLKADNNVPPAASQTFTLTVCNIINVGNPATTTATANAPFSQSFTQTGAVGTPTFTLNSGTLPAGLTLSSAGVLSGTPTVIGSFPITVKVTDANGCSGIGSTYTLDVNCQTITVTNPATTTGTAGAPFSQQFTQTNGIPPITWSLNSGPLPAGLTLDPSTGVISGTPTVTGCFPITVKATDANGCTGVSATYNLCINCQNITVTNPATTTGTAGAPFSQSFTQSGAIGGATFTLNSGSLPAGLTLSSAGVLSGTPTVVGNFPITVKVTDGNGCTGVSPTYPLVINCQTITVTNPATNTGTVDAPFSQQFTQSGAIGGATFTTGDPLPAGITLSSAGLLSGTPTVNGSFPITVTVTDGNGCTGTSNYTLTINCQTITVTAPGVNSGTVDTPFSQQFTQSGAHGSATFTTGDPLPAGITLSSAGLLSGTPTVNGVFPITVTVTDANGCTGSTPYTLTINCQTITVTNPANAAGTVDTPFSEQFTQSGAHGSATFSIASGSLPAGLTLDSAGLLSGTPTEKGSFSITVRVTDSNGCTGVGASYNLVINCQTITVTNPGVNTGTVDAPFSQNFSQSGAHGSAAFSIASGAPPAGLSLSTAGVLSGTPTVAGNFSITVMVTDANGCTGTGPTYNLTIGCQTISITNPATTTGTVDAAFSQQFTQSGAHNNVATFTLESGTLPAGLVLDADGTLHGTPTVKGSFTITVRATDGNGCFGISGSYPLVINCQTITVTNPSNTNGTVGVAFSEQFSQTGGHGATTFSTSSTLPSGFTLDPDGTLHGTTMEHTTFNIVVTATDANGCQGTGTTYSLIISCQTITVTNPATTSFPAGQAMSVQFTQTGAIGGATFTLNSGSLPTGLTLDPDGTLHGTPTQGGTFNITVLVTDGNGCTGVSPNYPLDITCPTITVTNPGVTTGTVDAPFSQTFSQTGAVGTATFTLASGTLPAGLSLSTAGVLSGTPTEKGPFTITVLVTDSNGCTGTSPSYPLVINCQTITVTNPATTTGTVDAAFSQQFTQSGAHGAATFTLASGTLPSGLILDSDGTLHGTPTAPGNFTITVLVTDSNGCTGTSASYPLVINCQTITVTNPATTTGTVDAPFSQQFTQSGAHNNTATFTLESGSLPAGLTLDPDGTLHGTPTVKGSFTITVRATDGNGCFGIGSSYPLVINCQAISVTNPGTNSGTVGVPFSQQFTQTGGHGATTFSTSSTLPSGFTLDADGTLHGTTMQHTTFNIVVVATDSNGCTGTGATYTLTINCQAITVINPGVTTGTVSAPFSQQFTQSGGIGGGTFSTVSTLPNGLTLDADGTLHGTPTQSGTFNIVVSFVDSNGCAATGSNYQLVIGCQTITVTNPGNNTGTAGQAFSAQFSQSGAVGSPTWSFTGSLPPGLNFNTATGLLSGTTSTTGLFSITVTATDASPNNSCSGTGTQYDFTINCQTISITNPTLNSITAGSSLTPASNWTFSATGILGTANWQVVSVGQLPSGITLNSSTGVLSGSSTAQGTYPITVRVTDTNGCFADSPYTLTVTCPVITPARTGGGTFPAATIGSAYAGQSFTASGGTSPYTFAVTGGTFPPGLSLASGGAISGTPTATGTFIFTVTATDANTCTGSASFSIAVNPSAQPDGYGSLVDNTQAYVQGGTTAAPATPAVALTGTIIANDLPAGGVAVAAGTVTSSAAPAASNNVTIAADGTFLYTPPARPGQPALTSDSFTYTITSNTGGTATPTQATGTVTLTLAGRVWYVKNSLGVNGNGQSQSPFNTAASFVSTPRATPDVTGDIIFIYNGTGNSTNQNAGIKLLDNEQLIGEGVALVVNSNTLVAAGTKPQITNTAGDGITLANGNTVKGLTVTGTSGNGIAGTNTNGLTIDTVTATAAGAASSALVLSTPSNTVTITNTTLSNSPFCLTINGGTANFTMNNTNTITANAGQRSINFNALGASAIVNLGAPITDNGTGMSVTNSVNGAVVNFTGTQTLGTTTNTAVTLSGNGATSIISFTGTLAITTSNGTGFSAGAGTLNVAGTANITTGAAPAALSLSGATVGASGIAFNSINATGATTGISVLNTTNATAVIVNGGTLANVGTGVTMQGSNTNLTLSNVTINGTTTTGVTNTTNFGTLTGNNLAISAVTALNLTTGTLAGSWGNVSSSGGTNGVSLNAVSGSFSTAGGALTGATGSTFKVVGGASGTIGWGGTINQANGALAVDISGSNAQTINFGGNVTTSGTSTGLSFAGSSGTYNFTGAASGITGTGGGISIGSGEAGTISFGSGYSINGPTTAAITVNGSPSVVSTAITYSGTILHNVTGNIFNVTGLSGSLLVNGTSVAGTFSGNGSVTSAFTNVTGTVTINHLSETSNFNTATGTGVAITGTNTGSVFTFNNLVINASGGTSNTMKGVTMVGGGSIAITATGGNSSIDVGSSALDLNGVTLNTSAIQTVNAAGRGANTSGILLTNVTGGGTLTISGGTLTGQAGAATFAVSGGSPSVTFSGTVTQNAANRAVDLQGGSGAISISTVSSTANPTSSQGVHIGDTSTNNGNVTFTTLNLGTSAARMGSAAVTISGGGTTTIDSLGTISIFTTGAKGLVASNLDGTLNVTGGTIDTSTATAIDISGPAGLTTLSIPLTSVNSAGGTADGISIQNTNGSFSIVGDGANTSVGGNSTGGTISGKSGADGNVTQGIGVYLNNVTNITLRRITINGTNQNYGIRAFAVAGMTLEYSTVGGTNGTTASIDNYGEGSVYFGNATNNGITGTGTFTNNSISGGRTRNMSVVNGGTAATLNLTVKGSTFGAIQNFGDGGDSFGVENRTSGATINVTFGGTLAGEPNTLTNAVANVTTFATQAGSTMDVQFKNNTLSNNNANNIIGGSSIILQSSGSLTYVVSGNSMRDANGSAIALGKQSAGTLLSGQVVNNTIGVSGTADSGSKTGNGIFVSASGGGTVSTTIKDNAIHQIHGNAHIYADNTGGSYTANFTIEHNTLDTWEGTNFAGIAVTNGAPSSSDTVNVCAKIGGSTAAEKNTLNLSGNLGVIVGSSGAAAGHTFNLPTYAGGANLTNVQNFIQGNNSGSFTTSAYADAPATASAFTGSGTGCPTP